MILLTQVNHWSSKRPEKYVSLEGDHQRYELADGDYFFLNTNRISDMVTLTGGGARFKYSQAPDDHRCSPDVIECNTSVADIITYADVDYPSKFVTMPIFPTNDITRVTIDTPVNTTVEYDDIAMVYCTPRDIALNVSHCVYYRNSWQRVTCILNYSFAQIQSAISSLTPLLDYDGNVYSTVVIGTQEWIVENLRTTHYADGTDVPLITDDVLWPADVTGAYCWYDNDITYKTPYGALYNWYAVNNAHSLVVGQFTEGGIASAGWRCPTVADWTALSTAEGGDVISGGRLKEVGGAHWFLPNLATDDDGWRGVANGNRFVDDHSGDGFDSLRMYNDTWTSVADPGDPTEAYSIFLSPGSTAFNHWQHEKFGGMAVRAVRDI
jgi:uncharacterized protein (TIGR02145 family)